MINIEVKGLEKLNRALDNIKSPAIRRKAIKAVGKELRKRNISRVVQQKNVDGAAYKKHAQGRKRKMLTRLTRRAKFNVKNDIGVLGWRNSFEGKMAARQHFGFKQTMTAQALAKRDKGPLDTKSPATRKQAKALRAAGYQVKRPKGKGHKTPTIKWITENLNRGKAGLILRILRGGAKTSWVTELPEREILGVSPEDIPDLNRIIKETYKQARAKQ